MLFHIVTESIECDNFPVKCDPKEIAALKGKIIDDSSNWKKPVELIFGKKFKLEVWETLIKSMKEKETSMFLVHKKVCFYSYIFNYLTI